MRQILKDRKIISSFSLSLEKERVGLSFFKIFVFCLLTLYFTLSVFSQNTLIKSLPFSVTKATSDGGSNNNSSYCGSANEDFVAGTDFIYSYTAPCDQLLTILFSNAGNDFNPPVSFIIKENDLCIAGYANFNCNKCSKSFSINAKKDNIYSFIADNASDIPYFYDLNVNGTECKSLCNKPSVNSSSFNFTAAGANEIISWTKGNGESRIVFLNTIDNFTNPVDGLFYPADNIYEGKGQQCVYNGDGNNLVISSLEIDKIYFVKVFEYCLPDFNYNLSSSVYSFTTAPAPPCEAPSLQSSDLFFNNIFNKSLSLKWTRGNGDAVLVTGRSSNTTEAAPENGMHYQADPSFGSGQQTGPGNYVLFNGVHNELNVNNLQDSTEYIFTIYEYNETGICYNKAGIAAKVTSKSKGCNNYCEPLHQAPCIFSYINNFTIADLNHSSSGCNNSYSDFSNIKINFSPGSDYKFTITSSILGNDNFAMWIDYNDDCDFLDDNEFLGNFYASSNTITGDIEIIKGAPAGEHRFRIRGCYNNTFIQGDVCKNVIYGETQDYTAVIAISCKEPYKQALAQSCTGTFDSGTTLNCTRGDGTGGVLIVARTINTESVEPINGRFYKAGNNFGLGDLTGPGNYIVYSGNLSSVSVKGLSSGTEYLFDFYEYNSTGPCYRKPASSVQVKTTGQAPCSDSDILQIPFTCEIKSNCTSVLRNNACGSSATDQAYIYKFIAPQNSCYWVKADKLEAFWNDTRIDISTGCRGAGNCISSQIGKSSIDIFFEAVAGQEYLISISGGGALSPPNCGSHRLTVNPCPTGRTCDNPELITELPFIQNNTTNCIGDNVTGSFCGNTWGKDKIYKYTPQNSECVSFNLTNFGALNYYDYSWVGFISLYEGCPNNNGVCLNYSNTNLGALLEGEKDYYLVVSYGANINDNCDLDYNIEVSKAPKGGSCCEPLLILPPTGFPASVKSIELSGTTCGKGNMFNEKTVNNNPFIKGQTALYEFIPPIDGCYEIVLEVTGPLTQSGQINNDQPGIFLFQGCPSFNGVLLSSAISSDAKYRKTFISYNLIKGEKYYLLISSRGTQINSSFNTNCIDFNLNISLNPALCNIKPSNSILSSDKCEDAPMLNLCKTVQGSNNPQLYTTTNTNGNLNEQLQKASMIAGNNSWLKFKADSTDIELYYWVSNCIPDNIGMQFALLETDNCTEFKALTIIPLACNGSGYIKASGLVPGKEYYLMMDHAGQINSNKICDCDFIIVPHYGINCPDCVQNINITTESIIPVKCYGEKSGIAVLSASGGTPPYSFIWEPTGLKGSEQYSLSSGKHKVTVYDNNNCSDSININIPGPDVPLTISIKENTEADCGANNGSATVTASGGTFPYSYKWSNGSKLATIDGLSSDLYFVTVYDYYSCSLSKSIYINTTEANLSIEKQASSLCLCRGAEGMFSITVKGTDNIIYQWYKDDAPIDGESNSVLNFKNVNDENKAVYYCLVKNNCGSLLSEKVKLSIKEKPIIAYKTNDIDKCIRDSALIKIDIKSDNIDCNNEDTVNRYQWYKNGLIIENSTNNKMILSGLTKKSEGYYSIIVSNKCGLIKDSLYLSVQEPPMILNKIENQTLCEGLDISLTISSDNIHNQYQWFKAESLITEATSSEFKINKLTLQDANYYSCQVSNLCSVVESNTFVINVLTKPILNIASLLQEKNTGETVSWTLSPTGTEPFTYQWYKDSIPIKDATEYKYTINNCKAEDAGKYSCVISNICGFTSSIVSILSIIEKKYSIEGKVLYSNKIFTPLKNIIVYLKTKEGDILDSTITDENAYYVFKNISPSSYVLEAKTKLSWKGVNPTDALLINKHYLNLYKISGALNLLAADVNNDNMINPLDALYINRRYIGIVKKFNKPDWIFEKAEIIINNNNLTKNIYSICTGDVNASW